jgi:hypothetical protein
MAVNSIYLREFISEKNRAIPNESADPEQCDRDKRIDLQNVVRQLGRDRTGEVAGRENKPEFHRGWHDEQRRECNFHHTEQSKITPDSDIRHLLDNSRIARELQYAQKRDSQRWNQVASKLVIIGPLVYRVTGVSVPIAPSYPPA